MGHSGPDWAGGAGGIVAAGADLGPAGPQALGALHTVPLAEEDLTVREISLPEKLELLAQAILDPDLEVFSTTQSLPLPGEPGAEQVEETFFKSVEYLADWNVLPESFDLDTLEFQSGSRAVYVRSDGYQSASMLYLQGATGNRDSFWIVVDEETGLPVWIDCSLRSVPGKKLALRRRIGSTLFGWPGAGGAAARAERVGN